MSKVIGIDISKQTFDVSFLEENKWKHYVFENQKKDFTKFMKLVKAEDWVVMEASGSYYLPLADFLHSKEIKICVENPLVIKRYSQTMLYRAKTDKKDARTIAEYGAKYDLKQWQPESQTAINIRQLYTRVQMLGKHIHQDQRQLEAFTSSGCLDKLLEKEIKRSIAYLDKAKTKLEAQIEKLAKEEYGATMEKLETIPGIGRKTSIMLALITDNFKKFENSKQLIAYVGFSPRVYQSGTSVRGKGHICKMGNAQIRKLLYVCTYSAKFWNPGCREMYARLNEKGKPERVIKIALANKLLKQAFAMGKYNRNYEKNYSKKLAV